MVEDKKNYNGTEGSWQSHYEETPYKNAEPNTEQKRKKAGKGLLKTGLSIAAVSLLLGLILLVWGATSGGLQALEEGRMGEIFRMGGIFRFFDGFSFRKVAVMDKNMVFEEITEGSHIEKMIIDVNYGTVSIIQGGSSLQVDGEDVSENRYKCNFKNGVLTIEDKEKKGWGFFYNNVEQKKTITITMPDQVVVDELEWNLGAGELSVDEFVCGEATINVGAGEIAIEKLQAGELDSDVGAGRFQIDTLEAGESSFSCGAGEMDITGNITGDIDVDCGVGEINLNLSEAAKYFRYDVDCGIGEVRIDGENYKKFNRDQEERGGTEVEVDCGVGSVDISFYDTIE